MSLAASPQLVRAGRRTAISMAAVGIVAYVAVYGAWLIFRWGGSDLEVAINDVAFLPLGLAAGLLQAYAIELHWDTTF